MLNTRGHSLTEVVLLAALLCLLHRCCWLWRDGRLGLLLDRCRCVWRGLFVLLAGLPCLLRRWC